MKRYGSRTPAKALAKAQSLKLNGTQGEYLDFTADLIVRFPDDPEIRLEYASALVASRPAEASEQAHCAVGLSDNTDPALLARAAIIFLGAGDRVGARSAVEDAERLQSDNQIITNELLRLRGRIAILDGEEAVADEALGTVHLADPANERFALDYARFLTSRGRIAEAKGVIDSTLATIGGDGKAAKAGRELLKQLRQQIGAAEVEMARSQKTLSPTSSSTSTGHSGAATSVSSTGDEGLKA